MIKLFNLKFNRAKRMIGILRARKHKSSRVEICSVFSSIIFFKKKDKLMLYKLIGVVLLQSANKQDEFNVS